MLNAKKFEGGFYNCMQIGFMCCKALRSIDINNTGPWMFINYNKREHGFGV